MRLLPLRAIGLAAAVAIAALPASASGKPKVAVLGLEVVEDGAVDPKAGAAARSLTSELREAAGRVDGALELAPDATKDLLELKLLSDCSDEGRRCMADIGKELKADFLLYGKLEKTRNGYQVSLKLLDVGSGQMSKTTRDIVPFADASPARLKAWASTFYSRLSGLPEGGVLVVSSSGGGTVYVDGELETNLVGGSARITGIGAGHHRVTIESERGERKDAEVDIVAGQELQLTVELDRSDLVNGGVVSERPGGSWRAAFWVAAGASAVGVAAWTVEAYRYSGLWVGTGPLKQDQLDAVEALNTKLVEAGKPQLDASKDACNEAAKNSDINGLAEARTVVRRCHDGQYHANMTTVLGVATVLGASAAAYFYYQGFVRPGAATVAEREARRRRARRPREPVVRFAPTISPTSVGAGLAIEF